jgi:lactobin A/cerein 7B family class IIb bacteriocin
MSKIVELSSKELNSVSGGISLLAAQAAAIAFIGAGKFISDYRNGACDEWEQHGYKSKGLCYAENVAIECFFHGVGHIILHSHLHQREHQN